MSIVHHRSSGWSFHIAPTLDRGWGYDPYVINLIGRIRAGRPPPESLFDSNSLFLDPMVNGRNVELARPAIKKREISAEEMAAYRADEEKRKAAAWEAGREARERRAAEEVERQKAFQLYQQRQAAAMRRREKEAEEWELAGARARGTAQHEPAVHYAPYVPQIGEWQDGDSRDEVVVIVELIGHGPSDLLIKGGEHPVRMSKLQIRKARHSGVNTAVHALWMSRQLANGLGLCDPKMERASIRL